jgi:hypothetical protein
MYLFEKHFNSLLLKLKSSGLAAHIEHLSTGIPTYADDMAIVSLHKPCMQQLLNIAYQYSQQWHFDFSSSKSVVMMYGKDTFPGHPLLLGREVLKVKQAETHMGILLTQDRDLKVNYIKERINKGLRAFFSIQSIGSRCIPVSVPVQSKLYWSNCISRMTYGMEVMAISDSSVQHLEQAHGSMAKLSQGLPQQTANVSCLATLGWRSMASHIDMLRILFLWRLLLLPISNVYKAMTLLRLCYHLYHPDGLHTGPLAVMVETYKKYGLETLLDNAVKSGHYMPMSLFKAVVNKIINTTEDTRFKATCLLYKSLEMFNNCIHSIRM